VSKAKYIEDAAALIDERVARLEEELSSEFGQGQSKQSKACDRAAISEARLCANLIRRLAVLRYGDTPYKKAADHRNRFGDSWHEECE